MNRRRHATAAITMICALTVLASPALTLQAAAAPLPPPPPKKTLEEVRQEIDALYRQAAVATDAYNLAEEKSKEQSAEIVRVAVMIVEGREKIEALKAKAERHRPRPVPQRRAPRRRAARPHERPPALPRQRGAPQGRGEGHHGPAR